MSKIKVPVLVLLVSGMAFDAFAISINELKDKNNELIALDVELAVAKKKVELAAYKPSAMLDTTRTRPATAKAPEESEVVAGIGGAPNALVADFEFRGVKTPRKKGETTPAGWEVVAVRKMEVDVVKHTPGKKDVFKTLHLQIKPGQSQVSSIQTGRIGMPMGAAPSMPTAIVNPPVPTGGSGAQGLPPFRAPGK